MDNQASERRIVVSVSGTTFYGACDPLATGVPKEEGWPEPTFHRRGRGATFRYDVTPEQAVQIASHLECLADVFGFSDDLDARREGRAFAKDARFIRDDLAKEELS